MHEHPAFHKELNEKFLRLYLTFQFVPTEKLFLRMYIVSHLHIILSLMGKMSEKSAIIRLISARMGPEAISICWIKWKKYWRNLCRRIRQVMWR